MKSKAQQFTDMVRKWQKELGLMSWEIFIESGVSDENRAWVNVHASGLIATVSYNKKWIQTANKDELERVAFHECFEILMMNIDMDMRKYYSTTHIETKIHEIIRTMENVILGQKGV